MNLDDEVRRTFFAAAQSQPPAIIAFPPTPLPRLTVPRPTTTLLGRDGEVAAVRRLLATADVRLVTLTGPGGAGKTHLAQQIAVIEQQSGANVAFVALATLRDSALVLPAVADGLGLPEATGRSVRDLLVARLYRLPLLLVLDNFEQVADAAADLATLLAECLQLRLLVTSRARLQLRGEHVVSVGPRPVPINDQAAEDLAQNAAVRLFVSRAQALVADFSLTVDNAATIAEICRRLDGLPLALEAPLWWYWFCRGRVSEGRDWLNRILAMPAAESANGEARVKVLFGAGLLAWSQRDLAEAVARCTDSVDILHRVGTPRDLAIGLHTLGVVARARRDYDRSAACLTQALELFRAVIDRAWEAHTLVWLGVILIAQGDHTGAKAHFQLALSLQQPIDIPVAGTDWLTSFTTVLLAEHEVERALEQLNDCFVLWRQFGPHWGVAESLAALAAVAAALGEWDHVARAWRSRFRHPSP